MGVFPSNRRKVLVMWAWSKNPTSQATDERSLAPGLRAPFAFGAVLSVVLIPYLWSALSGVELDPAAVASGS